MNKILISALFLSSVFVYSQELDQAYLKSLPENIRQDVLNEIAAKEETNSPTYRRPSTFVIKPDLDVESPRFGAKIFDMMQTSFMPINEPNFDSSYVLDFGDNLEIQLIGQKRSIDRIAIKRDGSISIPDIGKVFVSGLSLGSANELIKNKISNAYIGTEAFVTLVNIRDIQVLVTGNAYNPGIYTLNGNSNLLHALSMAGGIDKNGSYRHIDLIRNDIVISSLDLYDVFIDGKSIIGQRLRSGDSILIRPARSLASISGAVKRPATYELKPEETLLDLFNYGNGYSPSANESTLRLERLNKEQVELIEISDLNQLSTIKPIPGDRLNVRAYDRKSVTILGAIKTPGTYVMSKGETLSSLIKKAEGYKDNAYPFAGILTNQKTLLINEQAVQRLYQSFVQKLITKGDTLFASESLPFILEELKKSETSGRVMAEFDLDIIKAYPDLDTSLNDGDIISVPSITQQVYIYGEVTNTGTIRYSSGGTIDEYISLSGGLLESADNNNIFIIHPNGEIQRLTSARLSFLNKRSNSILVYPGSVIYVPRKLASRNPSAVASIWAPIVSALALSITSLSVLDNN